MLMTKKQLQQIVCQELNEGFFDFFKSKKTRRLEAEAEAAKIELQDRQKIKDYYREYLVIDEFFLVRQNWHNNYAFLCKDKSGKKTLWYQSGREKILVQIAGIGINPEPPTSELSPGFMWLCKSTPLKRPYGGSPEEKIYEILNTFVNGFNSRDALNFPNDLVSQLSPSGKKNFEKIWKQEVVKNKYKVVALEVSNDVFSSNINRILPAAIDVTSRMAAKDIDGSDSLLDALHQLQSLYSKSELHSEETYKKAEHIMSNLKIELGYSSMPPSKFDSSWADELY